MLGWGGNRLNLEKYKEMNKSEVMRDLLQIKSGKSLEMIVGSGLHRVCLRNGSTVAWNISLVYLMLSREQTAETCWYKIGTKHRGRERSGRLVMGRKVGAAEGGDGGQLRQRWRVK